MGLMKKLFTKGGAGDSRPSGSTQFADSEPSEIEKAQSRNTARRELVHMVLRETMGRHGIPSDWMDYRALSAMTRDQKSGMHVQLIVRKADQQLLPYVHAFQQSFREQLLRLDPKSGDWLFSLGWEFRGQAVQGFSPMPDPASWERGGGASPQEAGDTLPPEEADDDVTSDLLALQALMAAPAELGNGAKGRPRERKKT